MHSIIRTIMYNSDILEHSIGYDMIYVKKNNLLELCNKYPIDSVIEDIIKKYVELSIKKDIVNSDKQLKLRK